MKPKITNIVYTTVIITLAMFIIGTALVKALPFLFPTVGESCREFSTIRSFIHIRDVAVATLQIARHAPAGEIYHLSTQQTISIRNLVEKICQRMGVDFAESVEISEERLGKDYAYFLDSGKIRNTLGWADKISLEQGIEETIQWVEQNFEVLKTQPLEYIHKP